MIPDSPVPSAQRTLALLEILRNRPGGTALQDLLAALDISRSSLFALLDTLKHLGYVEQAGKRGYYYPGARLQAWQQPTAFMQQDQISAFYHEANLITCDETLALATPLPRGSVIIAQAESPQHVRSVYTIGQVYEDDPAITAAFSVLKAPFPAVRESGYAQRHNEDSVELALPICRDGSHADLALLLSVPTFRYTGELAERLLPALKTMAARLSYRLGAATYTPYQNQVALAATSAMSADQIDTFLKGPWTARLACLRSDQMPHVVPVWQEWDGQNFHVIAWYGSKWADYVLAQPQVSLTVDEPWPPFRRVTVHGTTYPLNEGVIDYEDLFQSMRRRFLGDQTQISAELPAGQVFRIVPEVVRGWKGMAVR